MLGLSTTYTNGNAFAEALGYERWEQYLMAFTSAADRADMADKFVAKAIELDLEVDIIYE